MLTPGTQRCEGVADAPIEEAIRKMPADKDTGEPQRPAHLIGVADLVASRSPCDVNLGVADTPVIEVDGSLG